MTITQLRKKAMALPLVPGVYIMKNAGNDIIYIGKAKALRNRVSQYFGSQANHSVKVRKMVENVFDFDYILVGSEFEALVLECSLIKQHKPKYNILLKDDKGFHYVKVTKGEWPVLSAALQKYDDDAVYYGPYAASGYVSKAVANACDIYKLPQCSKHFPADINRSSRPCLRYHIHLCSAPCCGKIKQPEYNEAVNGALDLILKGSGEALRKLKTDMLAAAENLEFERAARLRDQINAIQKSGQKQTVYSVKVQNQDVFAVATGTEKSCLAVLRFAEGRLYDSESFIVDAVDDAAEDRMRLIVDYYSMRPEIPVRVAVDEEPADSVLLEQWLSEKSGHKTEVFVPKQGEGARLIRLAAANASEKLSVLSSHTDKQNRISEELGKTLGLPSVPLYIEAYDISHTAGSETVGGMIVFQNGKPLKKAYRRFSVRSYTNDDCASMAEVLTRRLTEYENCSDSAEGFGKLPDLILLDGGKGEVNAVREVLRQNNLNIPLFGMVKDGKHRTRAIATSGGEIEINENRPVYTLIAAIQEEVHRFAVTYHRTKRKAGTLSLTLTKIDGIGEKRAKELLKHFGTLKAIREADLASLLAVEGMTRPAAEHLYAYYHNEDSDSSEENAE